MQSAAVVQICDTLTHQTKLDKMVFYIIKYDSLLKGSTTGTSIKFINSTVKQNLI